MIEINLSPKAKANDLNLGGFDLSYINVKMIVFALAFLYIPEGFLVDFYAEQIDTLNKQEKKYRTVLRKEKRKIRSLANIKKQLEEFNKQEKKLAEKLKAVQVIINKRQNPFVVLKYIAENMPENIWFTKLKIENKKFEVVGYAREWKDIGSLIESLKNSIFFGEVSFIPVTDMKAEYQGERVEVFKLVGNIVRFK